VNLTGHRRRSIDRLRRDALFATRTAALEAQADDAS
jgi:hypothetical protein